MFVHLKTLLASLLAVSSLTLVITPALPQAAAVPTDFTTVVRQKMPTVVAILTKQMIEDRGARAAG
jgi:serine protease Do